MTPQEFEALAAEAIDSLPPWVHERLENVEVVVEDDPPPGRPDLLGLYEGIPLTERGASYTNVLPDRISLYRSTIELEGGTRTGIRFVIRQTVIHEVAHHFGISDERLDELGRG
ncbi:MAG TPA: metallopeptidase family protein [Actinomycetota bacterium]|nr:metallopeptidase family protein [Actinomycetota bacterium]